MSLRLRLALWYGGLAGLVAILVSLVTYALHSRVHYDELDHALAAATEHLAEEYEAARTPEEAAAIVAVPISPGIAVRVYDDGGRVVAAGPNAALAPAPDPRSVFDSPVPALFDPLIGLVPPLQPGPPSRGDFGLAIDPDGSRWRLYVLPISRPAGYLVTASPLSGIDAVVGGFRRLVPLLAAGGAATAFVSGLLLAGGALRPVATLTETAASIARSRSLTRRVPIGDESDELGRLAATFNEMLASLEQAYQAQQRFAADASHELRAPLTAIQANLELVEKHPDIAAAERQQAVGEAAHEARRLAQLVADLMALARADAGVPIRRQPVELDRVLLDALAEARHLARGQRLGIEAVEPALVEGDPDRLKQLVLILLDNAIKYTPRDGKVVLALRRNGATADLTIRDTGVGISAEDLPHIFERFYRADPARARDPGGTGLGLPIARWIAEQHDGEISAVSAPDQGTMLHVVLPVAR
jgi:two-component system, OmpR family, sensor kinase